jgi:hypothetical protein
MEPDPRRNWVGNAQYSNQFELSGGLALRF